MIVAIVEFYATIWIMIFVHELGHYLAARALGVAVVEFSVGRGSTLISVVVRCERLTFRLLATGGFVKTPANSKRRKRIILAAGGPAASMAFGLAALIAGFEFAGLINFFLAGLGNLIPWIKGSDGQKIRDEWRVLRRNRHLAREIEKATRIRS
jgi:hypothetical protein